MRREVLTVHELVCCLGLEEIGAEEVAMARGRRHGGHVRQGGDGIRGAVAWSVRPGAFLDTFVIVLTISMPRSM